MIMKSERTVQIFYVLQLTLIFSLLLLTDSCENQGNPLFVGTWQFTESVNADNLVFNTTRTLVLTKRTYEETYRVERVDPGTISQIIGTKGDLVTTHSGMVFQLNQLGECEKDELEICTGNVVWHSEGSNYWNENIIFFKPVVPGEFEAGETTLWLRRDLNTDGDTDDAGEDITFERV